MKLERIVFSFTRHLPDISATLEAMLQPKVASLPGHIQAVYIQNIAKLYARLLTNAEEQVSELYFFTNFPFQILQYIVPEYTS